MLTNDEIRAFLEDIEADNVEVTEEIRQEEKVVEGNEPDKEKIEGYEMVEEKPEEQITVSDSSWIIIAIVIGLIGLLAVGWRKKI